MKRLLILGGTGDAAKLAREASQMSDLEVVYSLAGRTRNPNLPECKVRIGGFGGVDGLVSYLSEAEIDLVIDATHPFARAMAQHAAEACVQANIPRLKFCRPAWRQGDVSWISVVDYAGAAEYLKELGDRIFLSIGTRDLKAFSSLTEKWFLIRAVEQPAMPIPLDNHELLLERGPFDEAHERTLLVTCQIDALVSKNSGGAMAAKLTAAHDLGIPIVMIEQPDLPEGKVLDRIEDVLEWLQ
tara:strand:- start:1259 stop:1984 length:726 start_codon:yes stop_codon:yes gene_type:complete